MVSYLESLYDDFVAEAEEKLEELNHALLDLESDPKNQNIINKIFRLAHTLKGSSSIVGFDKITHLTHVMEDIFHLIRGGKLEATPEVLDSCFISLDYLIELMSNLKTDKYDKLDITLVLRNLKRFLPGEEEPSFKGERQTNNQDKEQEVFIYPEITDAFKQKIKEQNIPVFLATIRIKKEVPMVSLTVYILFNKLQTLGEIIWSYPVIEMAENHEGYQITVVFSSQEEMDKLDRVLRLPECETLLIKPFSFDLIPPATDTSPNEKVNKEPQTLNEQKLIPQSDQNNLGNIQLSSILRVESRRIDTLLDLVGELIINRSRFLQITGKLKHSHEQLSVAGDLKDSVTQLQKITNDLQEGVMKLRMISISQIFNKLPRLVRDTSRKLSKKVILVIKGQDTELDKRLVEEIQNPIIHIIRNCLDHGIETPDERRSKGKEEKACLKIEAEHEGNQIIITLSDDGRGIDPELIKEKALELGIITEEEASSMNKQDLVNIILKPGFSTKGDVSDISGRGVGMDVVKKHIEHMNGTLQIISEINTGTTFVIKLPLTLAIIPALLISLDNGKFAIPLSTVTEIITINKDNIDIVNGTEMISLREELIPLVRLKNFYYPAKRYEDISEADVAIVSVTEHKIGLIVDSFLGEQDIVIKSLNHDLSKTEGISGASILGDGTIALITDIAGVLRKTNQFYTNDREQVNYITTHTGANDGINQSFHC